MVGVSDPLLHNDPAGGRRFLLGFSAGLATSTVTTVLVVAGAANLLGHLGWEVRIAVLTLALVGFGVADLADRTPHVWRQVPQRFATVLPPGQLGFVWAYDLGLLVTTQKTTSLIWVALVGLVCTASTVGVAAALATMSLVFGLGVVLLTVNRAGALLTAPELMRRMRRRWIPAGRLVTGVIAFGLAAYFGARLWT